MRSLRLGMFLVGACATVASSTVCAETVNVGSHVDAATVFPAAVSIRRTARIHVGEGEHTVVFAPLPPALDDDSVRIGGFGPGATADAVSVRVGRRGELMQSVLIGLQSRLEAMQREQAQLAERYNALTHMQRGPGANQIAEALSRLNDANARVTEQSTALQQARALAEQPAKFVSVDVSTMREGDLDLSVEYLVPNGANWHAGYAAHLDETQSRVGLDVFASLQQNTGEDWDGVHVSVSTVMPASGLTVPQLDEVDIGLEPVEEPETVADLAGVRRHMASARAASMGGAPTVAPMMEMPAPTAPNAPIEMRTAETHAQALAARIEIPNRITLRSGATPRRVLAAHLDVDAALEYQAAPSQSSAVYLVSRFTNHAAFPLLAGRVALFVGNEYVGAAALQDVPIDEPVQLPFGADAGLTLERTLAQRHVARRGARDETSLQYQFRLVNHRERAANVTVFDRLPVAQTHGLVVRTVAGSRAAEPHHDGDAPGVVRWALHVDPGATTRWDFGYVVDMPRGRTLTGEMP